MLSSSAGRAGHRDDDPLSMPPHLSEAYRELGLAAGAFPLTERLAAHELSLPIGPQMSAGEVTRVVEAVVRGVGR